MEKQDDSFQKYRLQKQLKQLKDKRSEDGSTCLVSLYIPEGRQVSDFVQELTDELGTAANIKSKTTRKNVQSALQVTIGQLKLVGQKAPKNGLALFTGVTTGGRMERYVINPNSPIGKKQYVCDSFFHIDGLEEHLVEKKTYGLITIDAGYATIATLKGNRLKVLKSSQSQVPKKHKAGGQSAPRFQRIRIMETTKFLKRVAELAKDYFVEDPNNEIAGLIIGGPGLMKQRLAEEGFFDPRLQKLVLKTVDIGMVSDREGMNELVEAAKEILEGTRYIEEKKMVQRWLDLVYRDDDKATYGEAEIRKALELGAVEMLLASEEVDMARVELTCSSGDGKAYLTVPTPKVEEIEVSPSAHWPDKSCNGQVSMTNSRDLVEELGSMALDTGAHVEIISPDTEEGQQLLHFGGLAAILRYSVNY